MDEPTSTHERFEITRSGQRVTVLMGAEDSDALRETIAVLGDAESCGRSPKASRPFTPATASTLMVWAAR